MDDFHITKGMTKVASIKGYSEKEILEEEQQVITSA